MTNYAKAFPITIKGKNSVIQLFYSYKLKLRNFKRKSFDPFRRRKKIYFHDRKHYTTVAQLNFLKWVVENNILDCCLLYKEKIHAHMEKSLKTSKEVKNKKMKKRITLTSNKCNMNICYIEKKED